MKILVALPRFPWPTDKGDRLRAFKQIEGLSRQNEIHLICTEDSVNEVEGINRIKQLCKSVEIVKRPLFSRLWNLFKGLFNTLPFQVNYYKSRQAKQLIARRIAEIKPDLVYVQLIRMNENIPDVPGIPMVLDFMDAFSAGMEKREAHEGFFIRPWVRKEARRLKKYETEAARRYSRCTIISEQDRKSLHETVQNKTVVVPNGVNPDFLEGGREAPLYDLLFTGNLGYHPNIVAATFLVEKILPELQTLGLNLTVCLAGARPASQVLALRSDKVSVFGPVPDLRPYFRQSRIFVAPLLSGSGLQNKLLESMAMGLPTLTTPLSAAGLGATPGVEIGVCEDAALFAAAIAHLLRLSEEADRMAKAGQEFVKTHFAWEAMNAKLEETMGNAKC